MDVTTNQRTQGQVQVFGGQIDNVNILSSNYESDLIEYEKAYFNDTLAKTTIDLLISPISQSGYQIIIKDEIDQTQKTAKKIIEETLNNLIDGFSFVKQHCLFAVVTGSQFFEIVWKIEKSDNVFLNRIVRLVPIKNENIINYLYNNYGDFVGLEVVDASREKKTLKKDDLFYCIHNQYFNDIRGISELRSVLQLIKTKQALLSHSERTSARGVGVPIAYATENFDTSQTENYKNILRKIANTDGAYALISKQDIEKIEFLTVNQSDVLPMLEFINRDIFFNTLTQFLTTGLGQNGSRATAEELKSPYILKMRSIAAEIENYLQWLCNIIIDNSSLSISLKKENYPIFRLSSITDADVQVLSSTLVSLAGVGLKLNDDDFDYIRDLLKLPNKKENIETEGQLNRHQLRQPKITDFEVFELEEIESIYNEIDETFAKFINEIIRQIATDIYIAKKTREPVDFNKIYEQMTDKMLQIKDGIYKKSKQTAINELKKLSRNYESKTTPQNVDRVMEFLIKIIDAAKKAENMDFFSIGGIEEAIKSSIKYEINYIKQEIKRDVQNARGEILAASNAEKFRYIATLDKSVCSVCEVLHNTIYTKGELRDAGLNFKSPVNPECLGGLGGNICRCQIVPVK